MGMLKEGVRLDRVRGGRQKYRRNPAANPYQLMLPQSTSQIAPTSLEEIKMLETLIVGEPELLTIGHCGIDLMNKNSNISNINSGMIGSGGMSGGGACGGVGGLSDNDSKIMHGVVVDDKMMDEKKIGADAHEMLSVLSDIYDKELVGVIGWAKQIPGKLFYLFI